MLELWDKSSAVDFVTLKSLLETKNEIDKAGGVAALAGLTEVVPTAANVKHYAELVRGRSVLRKLIRAGTDIVTSGYEGGDPDELLDGAEASVLDIRKGSSERGIVHVETALKAAFEEIERLHSEKRQITGVATGFDKLGKLLRTREPITLPVVNPKASYQARLALRLDEFSDGLEFE